MTESEIQRIAEKPVEDYEATAHIGLFQTNQAAMIRLRLVLLPLTLSVLSYGQHEGLALKESRNLSITSTVIAAGAITASSLLPNDQGLPATKIIISVSTTLFSIHNWVQYRKRVRRLRVKR